MICKKIVNLSIAISISIVVPNIANADLLFSQEGAAGIIPIGHEYLTNESGMHALNKFANYGPDEPGYNESKKITSQPIKSGLKDYPYNSYIAYQALKSAVLGQRWVDIGGFNVATNFINKHQCFDAVAQNAPSVQLDHYMRGYYDDGNSGAITAIKNANNPFLVDFVNAAMAPSKLMKVYDGGGTTKAYTVQSNYYLFGRAVHLFQDSFSPEHTVRVKEDNYRSIKQIKSYMCSTGAEQHSRNHFKSGDIIWTGRFSHQLKPIAERAIEASADLWYGFIQVMDKPITERKAFAIKMAKTLKKEWLSFDENEVSTWYDSNKNRGLTYVKSPEDTGKGITQEQCLSGLHIKDRDKEIQKLINDRNICLENITFKDEKKQPNFDKYLGIPTYWKWKNKIHWVTTP